MLKLKELVEIREGLINSGNPLFFFDNDVDGLCSFLILRRFLGRGMGVAIKSFPELNVSYLRKVNELKADSVFVLDKPEVSEGFINGLVERGIPVYWIDHHKSKTSDKLKSKVNYFNSLPTGEPVTYIAYRVVDKGNDLWLAMIGCIGDVYKPDFSLEFEKKFPELYNSKLSAFDAMYSTELGKIVRMLNFGLMDSTTNVMNLIKYLFNSTGPYDILEENSKTRSLHKKYQQLLRILNKQVEKAEEKNKEDSKLLIFSYSGNVSMSSEIANYLYFLHREKLIFVAYNRKDKINISIRGDNALEVTKKLVDRIEGASGGGHREATGMTIPSEKWKEFKMIVEGVWGNKIKNGLHSLIPFF